MIPLRDNSPEKVEDWLVLTKWLDVATAGLYPEDEARIAAEIEAHFTDAVVARLAEGYSEVDARKLALQELGDPKLAGKEFRQKYLTIRETQYLAGLRYKSQGRGNAASYICVGLLLMGFFIQGRSDKFPLFLVALVVALPLMYWSYWLAGRVMKKLSLRSLLLLDALPSLSLWILFFMDRHNGTNWFWPVLLGVSTSLTIFSSLRTWNKFQKASALERKRVTSV